jgi:hypothetical protein
MSKDSKVKEPPLKSASFWEMAALAIGGRLASCQSCVEFWYFQSKQNAVAFLDSCAAGGLVEKMSLIDLRADLDPVSSSGPTLQQEWYDQAIYISAPAYRMHNLDASRDKIEGTKNAVYNAFRLYHEDLKTNINAIDAAYQEAFKGDLLRYPEIARSRKTVNLSHVAKLRLILDGFKCTAKREGISANSLIEKRATEWTIEYVVRFWDAPQTANDDTCDHADELVSFINEFLDNHRELEVVWGKYETRKLPARAPSQMLRVISHLVRHRLQDLAAPGEADGFRDLVLGKLAQAQQREKNDEPYVLALEEVIEEINDFSAKLPMLLVEKRPNPMGSEAR